MYNDTGRVGFTPVSVDENLLRTFNSGFFVSSSRTSVVFSLELFNEKITPRYLLHAFVSNAKIDENTRHILRYRTENVTLYVYL